MPIESLNDSPSPTEEVRSLLRGLVESPAETLTGLNPNRRGFISTLGGKPFREFTQEERRAAVRIVLSSFSPDDLKRAFEELLDNVAFIGEDDDYSIHLLVKGEIERRRVERRREKKGSKEDLGGSRGR